jgi:hypothetical protein
MPMFLYYVIVVVSSWNCDHDDDDVFLTFLFLDFETVSVH